MIVSREAPMEALRTILQGVTFPTLKCNGATTWAAPVSRRVKLWADVPVQPALFIAAHAEDDAYTSEVTPSKTTINVSLFVYVKTADKDIELASDLNLILDGIDAALAPSPVTGRQTLGGIVSHCRREGNVLLDPGDLDGQGLAVIPLRILVP